MTDHSNPADAIASMGQGLGRAFVGAGQPMTGRPGASTLSDLEGSMDELSSVVDQLHNALDCVLRPIDPQPAAPPPAATVDPPKSDFTRRLEMLRSMAVSIRGRIASMHERLEV